MEQVKAEPVEELRDLLANAYAAGATDTHNWWAAGNVEGEADFGEAASDYAASVIVRLPNPQPSAVDGLVEAAKALLAGSERHIFSDECLSERTALRQALAQIERKPASASERTAAMDALIADSADLYDTPASADALGEVERMIERLIEVRRKNAANFDRNGAAWEAYDRAVLDGITAIREPKP